MLRLCVVLTLTLIALVSAAPVQAQRLFVSTEIDPSGIIDDAQRARAEVVVDLKTYVVKKLPRVTLVDAAEGADIVVDVTAVGTEDNGQRSVATSAPIAGVIVTNQGGKVLDYRARATITKGTYRTAIDASLGPFNRSYGENLGRKFEDWIKKDGKK